jgi:mRNA interferase RelE/StbE|uniref:Cytotoxic translational repressor n=1 Tax=Siphoviridae sp. ctnNB1 TaxID=2825660 RepID=A0A8S5UV90_9CAUD|nr:MAG TPA: Cytotoxic translational repressor [Siphoviridae sp. ctnNB1]
MYRVVFTDKALKTLKKFDKNVSRMILSWIRKNLEGCDDPRRTGKALTGNYAGRWRYRVGDYRIMAEISDETITIYVVNIGHRKNIY